MSSERAQLCPLTPGPVLHPLISRETWCKATELKHCQAPQTYERCDFCPQQTRYEDNRHKSQMMSLIDVAVSCLHPPYISSCHAKKNKFLIKHWLQTPPTAFIPFHHNPPKSPPSALHFPLFILSLLHVLSCCKTTVRLCDFYQHTVLVLVYLDISVKLGCCSHRTWRDLSDAVSLESNSVA